MKRTAFVVALALLTSGRRAGTADPPKLAVIIVVDQMRADYVDRFRRDWTAGLKRLVTEGAWFTRASYPYLLTVTCAGHATIATGSFPNKHGIFANQWWDRAAGRQVVCTDDEAVANIGYDGPAKEHNSGARVLVETFADRMRTAHRSHVVTLSIKARSAIMLAGHGGDAVTWMSEGHDRWLTSTAFSKGPVPAVARFIHDHPVAEDFGRSWTPLLPLRQYRGADAGIAERALPGWTSTFPHVLKGTAGKQDETFRVQWEASPFADAYLANMAASLTEDLRLGKHDGTDVLGISFSSPDLVGHKFGPRSMELQDQFARLDRTLGALLDRLDAAVGRGRYVVALTADHGVTAIPEQLVAEHVDGGRIDAVKIAQTVEGALRPHLGAGPHIAKLDRRDLNVYFAAGIYDRLRASPPLMDVVMRAIAAAPGVQRVFRGEELRDGGRSTDAWRRAAALSYTDGRSGDIVIAPRPGWIGADEAASHGTASPDDQRVPILFMGHGIKAGRYDQPVTPADIAPTLAAICGITMPQAEGRVLRAALK